MKKNNKKIRNKTKVIKLKPLDERVSDKIIDILESADKKWNNLNLSLWFKKCFGYNDTFKIQVFSHGSNSEFWCIWYKSKGWFNKWNRLEECYHLGDSINLLSLDFPYLEKNFAFAVEFAKTLNQKKINEWNARELDIYSKELVRLNQLGKEKINKVWKNY